MANNDNRPSYGERYSAGYSEGYSAGYEDAKAEAAEVLREFISYEMGILKEFSNAKSYVVDGMGIVLNALLVTCKSHCIFDEVVDDD